MENKVNPATDVVMLEKIKEKRALMQLDIFDERAKPMHFESNKKRPRNNGAA